MRHFVLMLTLLAASGAAFAAETTIVYDFASESVAPNHETRHGSSRTTSTIDGPRFRNVSARNKSVELSDDDGTTTYFGELRTTPQHPLGPDGASADGPGNLGPIGASIDDEKITMSPPSPGPTMFGLSTHVYTVDYRYTIAIRIASVPIRHVANEEHYTITAADADVSSAALRVAFSRGYGHAITKHPEGFVGLPLLIEGTLKSETGTTTVRVEATSLQR